MSEALRTVLIAFGAFAAGLTWQSVRTSSVPTSSPQRLVDELRLAQMAALLLTLTAGAYVGFAVVREHEPGVGLDIALAAGFLIVAAVTMVKDPRQALTIIALRTPCSTSRTGPAGCPRRWRRGGIRSAAPCTMSISARSVTCRYCAARRFQIRVAQGFSPATRQP